MLSAIRRHYELDIAGRCEVDGPFARPPRCVDNAGVLAPIPIDDFPVTVRGNLIMTTSTHAEKGGLPPVQLSVHRLQTESAGEQLGEPKPSGAAQAWGMSESAMAPKPSSIGAEWKKTRMKEEDCQRLVLRRKTSDAPSLALRPSGLAAWATVARTERRRYRSSASSSLAFVVEVDRDQSRPGSHWEGCECDGEGTILSTGSRDWGLVSESCEKQKPHDRLGTRV